MVIAHDPHPPATTIALKDIQCPNAFHEIGPSVIPGPALPLFIWIFPTAGEVLVFLRTA
jgi:hypothetical protein